MTRREYRRELRRFEKSPERVAFKGKIMYNMKKILRKEVQMDMRKIGINMGAMTGLSDEEYAATVRELGFEAVFTGVPSPEKSAVLGALFAKYGLAWETMHAPFGHINDIWLDTEGGRQMYRELITTVDRCHDAGVPVAVVHLSAGVTPPPITDIGRARWTSLVEYAVGKRVRLAFENQRKLANLAYAMETFFDVPEVGFCYDCGHESCFTPGREYMPLFGNRLCCLHIHDNDGVYNKDQHLIPFDGKMDFARVTRQIRESGFTGTLMLEVIAKNSDRYGHTDCKTYLAHAAEAAKRLRDMLDHGGSPEHRVPDARG